MKPELQDYINGSLGCGREWAAETGRGRENEEGGSGAGKVSGDATGRRIVVTTDGGRVRLRGKRRGKTKKRHKRFKPAWREPRLFMIYATDEHGRLAPAFSPIIDGSLGSCDQFFRLLLHI